MIVYRYKLSKYIAVVMITVGIIISTIASAKDVVSNILFEFGSEVVFVS